VTAGNICELLTEFAVINECSTAVKQLCEQKCVDLPIDYRCDCYDGFALDKEDKKSSGLGRCSQGCENKVGSYKCSCVDGYAMSSDDRTCKRISSDPEPWLLFANKHYIRKLTLDGENYELVARGFENVISMDIDMKERKAYLVDSGQLRLYRVGLEELDQPIDSYQVVLRHNVFGTEGQFF
ncbi:unnamed protein product, partial [Gongylonema pulchrum]|uniref:EGF_CA domain-containing protein n=1 Tax=Gongylonema pulchrum TaxID=637853 RepID=A0A183E4T9_9BILA